MSEEGLTKIEGRPEMMFALPWGWQRSVDEACTRWLRERGLLDRKGFGAIKFGEKKGD